MQDNQRPILELTPPGPEVKRVEPLPEPPMESVLQISFIRDMPNRKVAIIQR